MDQKNIKDKIGELKTWVAGHARVVIPAVLAVCAAVAVPATLSGCQAAAEGAEVQTAAVSGEEAETAAASETAAAAETADAVPVLELEEDAYPAVNTLIQNYYEALSEGNLEAVGSMNHMIEENARLRIQEMSKYIDTYSELKVYTKKGPQENSYLAYVYSKVKFTEYDKLVPGMQAFYICTDESGNCYINGGEDDTAVTEYIRAVSLQDDVVELNNQVAAEYNELLDSDEELTAFLADLGNRIDASVGEALEAAEKAEAEAAAETAAQEAAAAQEGTDPAGQQEEAAATEPAVQKVRAKEVVNVRSSDSETADKLGKAQTGEEFVLLEDKPNGWSKIRFGDKEAYIKTEFLEAAAQEESPAAPEETEAEAAETEEPAAEEPAPSALAGQDTVTVIENVNVRKSASENGEKLGLVYIGEKLELLMRQADGWTKVKYKGQTAYVKSEYVE